MRAIVTGGAGFIGSHLIERLLAEGDEVIGIDDFSRGNDSNLELAKKSKNFVLVSGDLTLPEFASEKLREADVLFHLAAVNGTLSFYERPLHVLKTNLKITENVLRAANDNGIKKVIFASSAEVYGYPSEIPTSETATMIFDSPEVARWSYAIGKLNDENLCYAYNEEYGLETICLRLFNTYGPRLLGSENGQVISIFVKRAIDGQTIPVFGDGNQTRSFCYVTDTVQGFHKCSKISFKKTEVFNIGKEGDISINDSGR